MKPAFKIIADDKDITDLIADRLVSLEITDQAGIKSDQCTITLDDRDQRLKLPRTGAKLQVSIGYVGQQLVKKGQYVVDEIDISGPLRTMTIRANAADMTGEIKAPRERSWPNITLGNLARTIASEHGLSASIPAALSSRNLGHIDQCESDMQLLTRICTDQGATLKVADRRLVIADRAAGKTASGSDLPKPLLSPGDGATWNATLADRSKYRSVVAYWTNLTTAQRMEERAGSGTPELALKNSYPSQTDAKNAAASKLKALNRAGGKITVNGVIGDPTFSAEQIVTLQGFRDGIDGSDWVLNEVTHSLTASGYTMSLNIESK